MRDVLPRRPGPRRRLRRVEVDVPLLPLLRRRGLPALALGGAADAPASGLVNDLESLLTLAFSSAKFCKFLAGSFSAVSKQNFARKYAFDSIFQALQDLHPFAPL